VGEEDAERSEVDAAVRREKDRGMWIGVKVVVGLM